MADDGSKNEAYTVCSTLVPSLGLCRIFPYRTSHTLARLFLRVTINITNEMRFPLDNSDASEMLDHFNNKFIDVLDTHAPVKMIRIKHRWGVYVNATFAFKYLYR